MMVKYNLGTDKNLTSHTYNECSRSQIFRSNKKWMRAIASLSISSFKSIYFRLFFILGSTEYIRSVQLKSFIGQTVKNDVCVRMRQSLCNAFIHILQSTVLSNADFVSIFLILCAHLFLVNGKKEPSPIISQHYMWKFTIFTTSSV